jgi:hypothetical protein
LTLAPVGVGSNREPGGGRGKGRAGGAVVGVGQTEWRGLGGGGFVEPRAMGGCAWAVFSHLFERRRGDAAPAPRTNLRRPNEAMKRAAARPGADAGSSLLSLGQGLTTIPPVATHEGVRGGRYSRRVATQCGRGSTGESATEWCALAASALLSYFRH